MSATWVPADPKPDTQLPGKLPTAARGPHHLPDQHVPQQPR